MTTFQGQKVFRPQGRFIDHPSHDWEAVARKAISHGSRIVRSSSGDYHIVSPLQSHQGTYRPQHGVFEGGTLQKLQDSSNLEDITQYFG